VALAILLLEVLEGSAAVQGDMIVEELNVPGSNIMQK